MSLCVVTLNGGLGNQMFQYAFGRVLAARGNEVVYDASAFEPGRQRGEHRRAFGLTAFQAEGEWLSGSQLEARIGSCRLRRYEERPENVYRAAAECLTDARVSGYFQCYRYYERIRSELIRAFVVREEPSTGVYAELARKIEGTSSVSVHVRRGDYLVLDDYGACTLEYYREAARYLAGRVTNPTFFVFSDDLAWARENLQLPGEMVFADTGFGDRPELDISLMSRCRHHIIANSSFSWWGAWLDDKPGRIVVAPSCWTMGGRATDIVPTDWIRLENFDTRMALQVHARTIRRLEDECAYLYDARDGGASFCQVQEELGALRQQVASLKSSASYRVGLAVTAPLRWFSRIIRRR